MFVQCQRLCQRCQKHRKWLQNHFYCTNSSWEKVMFSQACVIPSVPKGKGVGFPTCITGHKGGLYPGGLHLGGSASKGVCILGSLHSGRFASRVDLGRPPLPLRMLRDTVNERAVRILLECILVCYVNIAIDTALNVNARKTS